MRDGENTLEKNKQLCALCYCVQLRGEAQVESLSSSSLIPKGYGKNRNSPEKDLNDENEWRTGVLPQEGR